MHLLIDSGTATVAAAAEVALAAVAAAVDLRLMQSASDCSAGCVALVAPVAACASCFLRSWECSHHADNRSDDM
jgi:hypothetical protein